MRESLAIRRELNDPLGIASSLHNIGTFHRFRGNLAEAQVLLDEAIDIRRKIEDINGLARSLTMRGGILTTQGNYADARANFRESLRLQRQMKDRVDVIATLEEWGVLLLREGHTTGAARIWGYCAVSRRVETTERPPEFTQVFTAIQEEAKKGIAEADWEEAWARGELLSLDSLIATLLRE